MADLSNRRPLKSRQSGLAGRVTVWLAGRGITPNQISMASMGAALIAGLAFWAGAGAEHWFLRGVLLIVAALGCQLRLLCNLFDGMVAVEAGKGAPDGPFWNEFPDRVSDVVILVGVGLGVGFASLGWAAAVIAVLTAYTREMGANVGAPVDFGGPMAKPHRMALVTGAAVVAVFFGAWVLEWALWGVVIGGLLTVGLRARRVRVALLRLRL